MAMSLANHWASHVLRAWKARLLWLCSMQRLHRFWIYLTQPWFAPLLRQVVLCRAIVITLFVLGVAHLFGWSLWPCMFSKITGLPCPGCGMTRAVAAMLHGQWHQAMLYHPFAPGFVVLGLIMMVCCIASQGLREKVSAHVEKLEAVTKFTSVFLLSAVIYGLLRMGGLCSNHATVEPLSLMSRHFGAG